MTTPFFPRYTKSEQLPGIVESIFQWNAIEEMLVLALGNFSTSHDVAIGLGCPIEIAQTQLRVRDAIGADVAGRARRADQRPFQEVALRIIFNYIFLFKKIYRLDLAGTGRNS
jgi:hypothetical protein